MPAKPASGTGDVRGIQRDDDELRNVKKLDHFVIVTAMVLSPPAVMADFGQTDFGQVFWPTEFGQTEFDLLCVVWCVCCCVVVLLCCVVVWRGHLFSRFHGVGVSRVGVGFKVWFGPPFPGPPFPGPPFPWTAFNFVLFFPLWGSSRGILVVFVKAGILKCARLALWLLCEAPAAFRPPGLHTTVRELQTCTFSKTQNSPKRGRKE